MRCPCLGDPFRSGPRFLDHLLVKVVGFNLHSHTVCVHTLACWRRRCAAGARPVVHCRHVVDWPNLGSCKHLPGVFPDPDSPGLHVVLLPNAPLASSAASPTPSDSREVFAAAFNRHSQRGTKPDEVVVPVAVCYPQTAAAPMDTITIGGSARIKDNGGIEWESGGYGAWLRAVQADLGDVLLLWATGVDQQGWEAGRVAQVSLHLIQRAKVGQEALNAVLAVVSG